MSGIFGIYQRDGLPVNDELPESMREKMAHWGPDSSQVIIDGPIGLGQCMLYNTPEALNERLPRRSTESDILLTCEARIDNRQELLSALSVPREERDGMPDSELVLRAYRKWGITCPEYLIGDWSFAVWDDSLHRLFLARDHRGNTALYYYTDREIFAFASAIQALLGLPKIERKINELYLAQKLVSWSPDPPENTIYENIKRLPDAHSMTITFDQVKIWRYWFMENIPELHLKSEQDYIEGFLAQYREAVRCRLRSFRPVCAHLSSGLDSGSVVALAAEEMRFQGKRLQAYTSVPAFDIKFKYSENWYGNEWPLASATADFCGNVDLQAIPAKLITPIQAIRRSLEIHNEPLHAAANMYWMIRLMEIARDRGLGTLLTGQGGNATVSWDGWLGSIPISTLLRQWKLKQILKYKILLPIVPAPLFTHYRRYEHKMDEDPWSEYSAINPKFAHRINLLEQMQSSGHDPTFSNLSYSSRDARFKLLTPGKSTWEALHAEMGAAYNFEVRDPTLDKRLIEYCLGIPDKFYIDINDSYRLIIRKAMVGYLPDPVRLNKQRGSQAADIGYRLLADAQTMETHLETLRKSTHVQDYLDIEKMYSVWNGLKQEVNSKTSMDCITILLRGLMAGLFLINNL